MTTAFATQLQTIAAKSSNELNLRAQRDAHAESLIFERDVAIKQDWETIYRICSGGFQELCLLDPRLRSFEKNLFSPQSKEQDREQLNKAQNEALDIVIERCLFLLGSKLMLRPGIRAVEWLVRRFRIHIHNTSNLLATFLPFHESQVFQVILTLLPANSVTGNWKFLAPYKKALSPVPRHVIAYSATNLDGFFSAINSYTIRACQNGAGHSALLKFWSSVIVEAIAGRLKQVKSGRREVEQQRMEDVLLKVLPILEQGFQIKECPEMLLTCKTVSLMLATEGQMQDTVIDSLMEAVATTAGAADVEIESVVICLTIMVLQKDDLIVSANVLKTLINLPQLIRVMQSLETQYRCSKLASAVFRRAITGLKQRNYLKRLPPIQELLQYIAECSEVALTVRCLKDLIRTIQDLNTSRDGEERIRSGLLGILRQSVRLETFSSAVALMGQTQSDKIADLESLLMKTLRPAEIMAVEDDKMEMDNGAAALAASEAAFYDLDKLSVPPSFLQARNDPQFDRTLELFKQCEGGETLLDQFTQSHIWQDRHGITLISFLLRVACGPYETATRLLSLRALLKLTDSRTISASQAMLPYLTVCLGDTSQSIRKMSARILATQLNSNTSPTNQSNSPITAEKIDLYGESASTPDVIALATFQRILEVVYQPVLEECVLDSSQISKALQTTLDNNTSISSEKSERCLKKSHRQALLDLLTSHAVQNPLLTYRANMVQLLQGVAKAGSSVKVKSLSPILKQWFELDNTAAKEAAAEENLSLQLVDRVFVQLVSVQDKESIRNVLDALQDSTIGNRPSLIAAIFARIEELWKDLKPEIQTFAALQLSDFSFAQTEVSRSARSFLSQVLLSSDTLTGILRQSANEPAELQNNTPSKKRKRDSQGQEGSTHPDKNDLISHISRLTLALELVDGSLPEARPELLGHLFIVLSRLKQWRAFQRSENPYLLNLCLNSILAIVDRVRTSAKNDIDISVIRVDLVTDLVQTSESPSVASSAILLAASLSTLVPARMLHEIMPIFTFMGHNVLEKDDDHSVHAVNQAIDKIVPPLVAALRKRDPENLIQSVSTLLSSFASAYGHVSRQRRVPFYRRALQSLGVDDLGFALIMALAVKQGSTDSWTTFLSGVLDDVPVRSRLVIYERIIGLSENMTQGVGTEAEVLLEITGTQSHSDRVGVVVLLLHTAKIILSSDILITQFRRTSSTGAAGHEDTLIQYQNALVTTLGVVEGTGQDEVRIANQVRDCLTRLLAVPSLPDIIRSIPKIIQQYSKSELQTMALKVLADQLDKHARKHKSAEKEALELLPMLNIIVQGDSNADIKLAAVGCIDKIAEAFGRKDPDALLPSAAILASGDYFEGHGIQLSSMVLLCLASLLEILREMGIPIVQQATGKVLQILETIKDRSPGDNGLRDACLSYLASLVANLPFMISGNELDRLIFLLSQREDTVLAPDSSDLKSELVLSLSRKVELSQLVGSIGNVWVSVVVEGTVSIHGIVTIFSISIENSPKVQVVRSSEDISSLLLRMLDLRRLQNKSGDTASRMSLDDVEQIEDRLNDLVLGFIYKLNDTVFRPVFETWVEWATACRDIDADERQSAQPSRQTTLFRLLNHFFENLKSIVTNYSSYVLEPVVQILQHFSSLSGHPGKKTSVSVEQWNLYTAMHAMLRSSFSHDADGFYNSPSHFVPLGDLMVNQLKLAGNKKLVNASIKTVPITTLVLPGLVALASATMDTATHHHSLNHQICQLRHDESSSVRLASIKLHLALTESEVVGDDWVSNVVGLGSEGGGGAAETMVYVNEMLEDDDEEVEREVRRWVQLVREKVGEDTFSV